MNKKMQNKTKLRVSSLNFEDSNQLFNKMGNRSASALISKGEISGKTNNSIKGNGLDKRCVQTNNNTPRLKVTVEFAAKQLFQILLVDIKRRNAQLNGELLRAICV